MTIDFNTLALMVIALSNLVTAIFVWQTKKAAQLTEKNTNSMKDALVRSTSDAAHLAGREEGRLEAKADTALVAKGAKEQTDKKSS